MTSTSITQTGSLAAVTAGGDSSPAPGESFVWSLRARAGGQAGDDRYDLQRACPPIP